MTRRPPGSASAAPAGSSDTWPRRLRSVVERLRPPDGRGADDSSGLSDRGERPRVVVVGAGFAGLEAARELAAHAIDVVVVDRHNFHTFLPLLYQVATAELSAGDVAPPLRATARRWPNVRMRRGAALAVDWESHRLDLDDGGSLPFDFLILAAGSDVNDFGVPGVAEHALPLYTLADAVRLRNHVLARFEEADADPRVVDAGALTFVAVGGGPTGVEIAGALAELFTHVLRRDFPWLAARPPRVVLVEMTDAVLAGFRARSQRYALEALRERGVEVRLREQVTRITDRGIELASGEWVPTQTVIWAAGVRAAGVTSALDVAVGRSGRIAVAHDLSLPRHPEAFAAGDVADMPRPDGDGAYAQLAPVAQQSGRHAARQVVRRLNGEPPEPFVYEDRGIMATIGRRSAVAEFPSGLTLRGTLAWLAWLFLHLLFLIGYRNRLSVLVSWTWNYLTWDWGPRVIFGGARRGEGGATGNVGPRREPEAGGDP